MKNFNHYFTSNRTNKKNLNSSEKLIQNYCSERKSQSSICMPSSTQLVISQKLKSKAPKDKKVSCQFNL
jgi:Tfp pilus assembly pilus retraction ATPase PilT